MERKVTKILENADKNENIRTFIIYGMSGVGKTGTVLDYVKKNYEEYLYIDCSRNSDFYMFFENREKKEDDTYIDILTAAVSEFYGIDPGYLANIPVILDEPDGSLIDNGLFGGHTEFLKLFIITYDKAKLSSILRCMEGHKVTVVRMLPMDFGEFLKNTDKEWYSEIIEGHLMSRRKIPDMIHEELSDLFGLFMLTGGMPEIVEEYKRTQETSVLISRQRFLKYGILFKNLNSEFECSEVRVRSIWDAVESILEKDNHKFMYTVMRDGATEKAYEKEMKFLTDRGMLIGLKRFDGKNVGMHPKGMRYYYSDISMYDRPDVGKIMESLMIQEMIGKGLEIKYWESGKGASLDMVFCGADRAIPVEVKVNDKSNSRSVRAFLKDRPDKTVLRLSWENCRFDGDVISIPVYAGYAIDRLGI